jgi:hypothetical protein
VFQDFRWWLRACDNWQIADWQIDGGKVGKWEGEKVEGGKVGRLKIEDRRLGGGWEMRQWDNEKMSNGRR